MTTVYITLIHKPQVHMRYLNLPTGTRDEQVKAVDLFFQRFPLSVHLETSFKKIIVPLEVRLTRDRKIPSERVPLTLSSYSRGVSLEFTDYYDGRSEFRAAFQEQLPIPVINLLRMTLEAYAQGFPWQAEFRENLNTEDDAQPLTLSFKPEMLGEVPDLDRESLTGTTLDIFCGEERLVQATFHFPSFRSSTKKREREDASIRKTFTAQFPVTEVKADLTSLRKFLSKTITLKDRQYLGIKEKRNRGFFKDLKEELPASLEELSGPALQIMQRIVTVMDIADRERAWRFFVAANDLEESFHLGLASSAAAVEEDHIELHDFPPSVFNSLTSQQRTHHRPGAPVLRWKNGQKFANTVEKSGDWKLLSWCTFYFELESGWYCEYSARNYSYNLPFEESCSPYRVLRLVMVLLMRAAVLIVPIPESVETQNRISLTAAEFRDRPGRLQQYHRETLNLNEQLVGTLTGAVERLEELCGVYFRA